MNELKLQVDLEKLDKKVSFCLLEKKSVDCSYGDIKKRFINDKMIMEIEDFLSLEDCEEIIKNCGEEHYQNMNSDAIRDCDRILVFDESRCLTEQIEEKIKNIFRDKVKKCAIPVGFNKKGITYKKYEGKINPCLRISRYIDSKGFGWHRDVQFTDDKHRSNYSIIIYLNTNNTGNTVFIDSIDQELYGGLTIEDEVKQMESYSCVNISPKIGKAVIFDQRLIHKSKKISGSKYVLRSDLLMEIDSDINKMKPLENKIRILTQSLFRQAQYYDLINANSVVKNEKFDSNKLYEICMSLRLSPELMMEYPAHLEKLIVDIPVNLKIDSKNPDIRLNLASRNGKKHVFDYKCEDFETILKLTKICSVYFLVSHVNNVTNIKKYDKVFFDILKLNGLYDILNKDDLKVVITDDEMETIDRKKIKSIVKKINEHKDLCYDKEDLYELVEKYFIEDKLMSDEFCNDLHNEEINIEKLYKILYEIKYGFKIDNNDKNVIKIENDANIYVNAPTTLCGMCEYEYNVDNGKDECTMGTFDKQTVYRALYMDIKQDNSNVNIIVNDIRKDRIDGVIEFKDFEKNTLNHASCMCEYYFHKYVTTNHTTYLDFKMSFTINTKRNKIILKYVPEINM